MRYYKDNFNGEVVVITGAGRGIGKTLAKGFAADGASVACLATTKTQIDQTAKEITEAGGKAISIVCDVTDYASVESAFAQVEQAFGGVDIVIANAGINAKVLSKVGEDDIEEWKRIIEVNLIGAYYTCRVAIPYLKKRGGGKILATGSGRGIKSDCRLTPYSCSKAGLHILIKTLAAELKEFNIACNIVIPGPIMTEMNSKHGDKVDDIFVNGSEWLKTPEDFLPLVEFVASMPNNGPSAQTFCLNRREI